jgi:hypothetical protein
VSNYLIVVAFIRGYGKFVTGKAIKPAGKRNKYEYELSQSNGTRGRGFWPV